MSEPTMYEIVLRGHASARLLRPLLDDFTCARSGEDTRLVGTIRDAAHLHGVVIHLTSVKTELLSIGPVATGAPCPSPVPNSTSIPTPTPTTNPTSIPNPTFFPASRRGAAQEDRP